MPESAFVLYFLSFFFLPVAFHGMGKKTSNELWPCNLTVSSHPKRKSHSKHTHCDRPSHSKIELFLAFHLFLYMSNKTSGWSWYGLCQKKPYLMTLCIHGTYWMGGHADVYVPVNNVSVTLRRNPSLLRQWKSMYTF